MTRIDALLKLGTGLLASLGKTVEAEVKKHTFIPRAEAIWGEVRKPSHGSGHTRLRNIERLLDVLLHRSEDQKIFHEAAVDACLPLVYGAQWAHAAANVMKKRKLRKIQPEVLFLASRRIGKTIAVGSLVADLMRYIPGIRIVIFSAGSRASVSAKTKVKSFIKSIKGFSPTWMVKDSKEELQLRPSYGQRPSELHAYPANSICEYSGHARQPFSRFSSRLVSYCFVSPTNQLVSLDTTLLNPKTKKRELASKQLFLFPLCI